MTGGASRPLPLVFDEPRGRPRPPRHLADLTPEDRTAVVRDLGLPAFRADQVSRHYFTRLSAAADDWTDIPAAQRADLARLLARRLIRK